MKKNIITTLLALSLIAIPTLVYASGYCGDGIVDATNEECDDGNFTERDGCSNYCKVEDMTPPTIASTSIANDATNVSSVTTEITITFSEAVDPDTVNEETVQLKQYATIIDTSLDLNDAGTSLMMHVNEDLDGDTQHSIVIKNIKDLVGNKMPDIHVTNFTTGVAIDHTAPEVIAKPAGGEYNITQSVSLTAYLETAGYYTEEMIDPNAVIYYTVDGSLPTTNSEKYSGYISISKNSTLKYFAVDASGNRSRIVAQNYTFSCAKKENTTKVTDYPECKVEECKYGFLLKSNVCVINLGTTDEDDYKTYAATAPLFGSDTPMTISTKPALYITPEHNGIIPRPIHFKDLVRGTTIDFERDTKITDENGELFSGYILPPENLYSKNFPINFGFTFKSIFAFQPTEDEKVLYFDPPYKITIPFTERFDKGEEVTIFTYNPDTEEYLRYSSELFSVDEEAETVTITAYETSNFFVAQPGKNYNKIIFKDCAGHWAQNYIEDLYRKEIVKGRDKGIFAPDDNLTRAEFTKIALNAMGEEIDPLENVESAPFQDVAIYAWYVPYIKRAKEIGLINGYADGTFQADKAINRAEAITILMRAFKFNLLSAGARVDNFQDVVTSEWYFPAVNFSIQNKLIDGIRLPNGKIMKEDFGPGRAITRAEMEKLAVKTMELAENQEK